jgi:DNA-directed RNA polymerase subunit RPC12/RpoP
MTETNKRTWIQKSTSRLREVECPKCKARFLFRRARVPHFDTCGFESYKLDCKHCGASFAGIIDPYVGTLLLSAT